MKDFFYLIEDLFVNVLFAPYDALRKLELDSWFGANFMSWIFIIIGVVAFTYWMLQLKKFGQEEDERAHNEYLSSHPN